jgi:hypothetical protein
MSISFEDLQVGQRWQSTGRTLTDADLTIACVTSCDWHPIHADAEFAKESIGQQRIFHGTYGLHIAMGICNQVYQSWQRCCWRTGVQPMALQDAASYRRYGSRRGMGCQKRDRVAVLSRNRPEYPEAYGAALLGGFVGLSLNDRLSATEY